MTVQGGGGKKAPPGSTPVPVQVPVPASTPAKTTAGKTPAAVPTSPTASPPPSVSDAFETHRTDPRPAERIRTGAPGEKPATSGIDSMVRVLEDTRTQILDEHRALRQHIQRLVGELVAGGFERSLLDERRAELMSVRQRMAALRRRLQQIQRRLKSTVGKTRHTDAELGKQLTTQLDRLRKLEPGLQRALLALQLMEVAFVESWAGATHKVVGDLDAEARGTALARALPGHAVAGGIARMLADGLPSSSSSSSSSSASKADDDHGLAPLWALSEALKGSL